MIDFVSPVSVSVSEVSGLQREISVTTNEPAFSHLSAQFYQDTEVVCTWKSSRRKIEAST